VEVVRSPYVTKRTEEVFVAPDGHRYFTKGAAYRRAARLAIISKYGQCDCSSDTYDEPGWTCYLHSGDKYELEQRLIRLMQRADRLGK